jgi:hypothetical protein
LIFIGIFFVFRYAIVLVVVEDVDVGRQLALLVVEVVASEEGATVTRRPFACLNPSAELS